VIGTLAGWRAYATARGDTAPTAADDAVATAALVRASDHILHFWVRQFISGDETSPYVEEATYEAANFELATPGFFTTSFTPAQQKVLTEVKGIKWTVKAGAEGADAWANATPMVTKIAAMLDEYMPGKYRVGLAAVGP
jgi:hypothetical protein